MITKQQGLTHTTDARVYSLRESLTAHVQARSNMHVSNCYYKLIDRPLVRAH
jgi:hypothetical protein